MTIREDYFDEETQAWDEEKYEEDHREEEEEFLIETWESMNGMDYPYDGYRPEAGMMLQEKVSGDIYNIEHVIREQPDWFEAAQGAADYYANEFGLDSVDPAVIYSMFIVESGFKAEAYNSGSGASGLGQFLSMTWMTDDGNGVAFIEANKGKVIELLHEMDMPIPTNRNEWLALRFNPVINIYATTWYTAHHAERYGFDDVSPDNAYYLYLAHHDGFGGASTLRKRHERGQDVTLHSWQTKPTPEAYWNTMDGLCKRVADNAARYRVQLDGGAAERGLEVPPIRSDEVVLIGDSVTAGYDGRVKVGGENMPEENVHASVGKQVYKMKDDLERDIESGAFDNIQAVVLMGGGNDLADTGLNGEVDTITGNLGDMIEMLTEHNPDIKITLVTHHSVLDVKGYYSGRVDEVNNRTLEINGWIRSQGRTNSNIEVVDLYILSDDPNNPGHVRPDLLASDGLHLSDKGNAFLADQVGRIVEGGFR